MKYFTYKKYEDCYFKVNAYLADKEAMAISIYNKEEGPITCCTVYSDLYLYTEGLVTIKNYSENSHLADFLMELGVVTEIIMRQPCNPIVQDTLNSNNPQTIDLCDIDIKKLKEYSKEWNYTHDV